MFSYESKNFKDVLYQEARKNNIELNEEHLKQFELYKDILIEWNKKMNLTAITDEYQIIMKHFIDCLEVTKYIEPNSNVIDIGTGAGFPGIVIAIYFEKNIDITLVDALNKRITFLTEVKNILNLNNVNIVQARAEELGRKEEYREKFDYIVSRAVAPLNILLEYDIPFLKTGSKCLLLKSSNLDEEINNSSNALSVLNSKITNIYEYCYTIYSETYNRKIIEVVKQKSTQERYPRNYGKIKKNPL